MRVSVIGLGKLGAPMAAVLAAKGHTVFGVDVNAAAVEAIAAGRAPVQETGLAELLQAGAEWLTATTDYAEAVAQTDVTFVIVPTPSDGDGAFSMRYAVAAAEAIGATLAVKDTYHVVALTSTVMPGATGGEFVPALEAASGKRCGPDFGVCYSPEFIALGTVIRDMLNPDMVLVGESDTRAGDVLEALYGTVHENRPTVQRMNFVNAELTKLAVNTYVTMKISFANMLADVCEGLPGGAVDVVTDAVGADSRVGRKFLKGATGYGGPCFPRDNAALALLARQVGAPALLAEATDAVNRAHMQRLAERVLRELPPGGRVAVLGLSYKPDTWVIEESPGMALVRMLLERGAAVTVYDPAALDAAREELADAVAYAASAQTCAHAADVVVVTTPWAEFSSLGVDANGNGRRPVLMDCWRMFDSAVLNGAVDYRPTGIGPAERAAPRPEVAGEVGPS